MDKKCQIVWVSSEEKQNRILDAALRLCKQYGLKKISMAEIAAEAEMSRPALYNFYKNKGAIVKAVSQRLHHKALLGVEDALKSNSGLSDSLESALRAWGEDYVDILYNSNHGLELLGVSGNVGADISLQSRKACLEQLSEFFEQADGNGEIKLSRVSLGSLEAAELFALFFSGSAERLRQSARLPGQTQESCPTLFDGTGQGEIIWKITSTGYSW